MRGDTVPNAFVRFLSRSMMFAIVLLGIGLSVLWRTDNPRLEYLRMLLIDHTAPAIEAITWPLEIAGNMVRNYRDFFEVYNQNKNLRREIQRLRAWRETARLLEEENAQLRALNNVRHTPRITFVTGDIIADSGGPFLQSALVNVGQRDGVRDGAAAVDGAGLVGRVVGLGQRAARLMLLTDFSSRVPVVIHPSGHRAIVTGDGTNAPKLEFIDGSDRIHPGDSVETTGDGRVFPPDIPVGNLISTPSGNWRVRLLSDFSQLEFVRLLRYDPNVQIDQPGDLIVHPPLPAGPAPETSGNSMNATQ